MRTTVDLPDELYRHLKMRAAASGMKVKELITKYLEGGLAAPTKEERRGHPGPIPVVLPSRGVPMRALSPGEIRQIEEDEDLERYARSFGR